MANAIGLPAAIAAVTVVVVDDDDSGAPMGRTPPSLSVEMLGVCASLITVRSNVSPPEVAGIRTTIRVTPSAATPFTCRPRVANLSASTVIPDPTSKHGCGHAVGSGTGSTRVIGTVTDVATKPCSPVALPKNPAICPALLMAKTYVSTEPGGSSVVIVPSGDRRKPWYPPA